MSKWQIIQGDNMEILKTIADNSVDTIVTSPPYNLAGFRRQRGAVNLKQSTRWNKSLIDYSVINDDLDEDIYQQQQINLVNVCLRVLKPTGSIFYQHKIRRWGAQSSHPMSWLLQTQAKFYQEIIWDRGGTIASDPHYLLPVTESIYWLVKERPRVFRHHLPLQQSKTIWRIPPETKNPHPAPFPEALSTACILLTTEENDCVLDPYSGSGTTGVSAVRASRNYTGIELNPDFAQKSRDRIQKLVSKQAMFNDLFDYV